MDLSLLNWIRARQTLSASQVAIVADLGLTESFQ